MAATINKFVDGIFNNTLRFIINKKRYVTEHTEGAEVLSLIFSVVGFGYSGWRFWIPVLVFLNKHLEETNYVTSFISNFIKESWYAFAGMTILTMSSSLPGCGWGMFAMGRTNDKKFQSIKCLHTSKIEAWRNNGR